MAEKKLATPTLDAPGIIDVDAVLKASDEFVNRTFGGPPETKYSLHAEGEELVYTDPETKREKARAQHKLIALSRILPVSESGGPASRGSGAKVAGTRWTWGHAVAGWLRGHYPHQSLRSFVERARVADNDRAVDLTRLASVVDTKEFVGMPGGEHRALLACCMVAYDLRYVVVSQFGSDPNARYLLGVSAVTMTAESVPPLMKSVQNLINHLSAKAAAEPQCGNPGCQRKQLFRCARCKTVSYCSQDCQRADWRARHKKECSEKRALSGC